MVIKLQNVLVPLDTLHRHLNELYFGAVLSQAGGKFSGGRGGGGRFRKVLVSEGGGRRLMKGLVSKRGVRLMKGLVLEQGGAD